MSSYRVLVVVSGHGYGHLAQTAEVVNALAARTPALAISVQSPAPRELIQARIRVPFEHLQVPTDFGMCMASAVDVDAQASIEAYTRSHSNWDEKVARRASELQAGGYDLVLANIPYLDLAAATRTGIACVGLGSLNWADIYGHYCADDHQNSAVVGQMLEAYRGASCFIRVTPGLPMAGLPNLCTVGPVACMGAGRRDELVQRLGLTDRARLVMINLGGIPMRLPVEHWPMSATIRWVVPDDWQVERGDMIPLRRLGCSFIDALASVDALVTKVGYGALVEAACHGTPVLYLRRGDWPEEPFLLDWMHANARCREISRADLAQGVVPPALESLWALPAAIPPEPTGAREAAAIVAEFLPA